MVRLERTYIKPKVINLNRQHDFPQIHSSRHHFVRLILLLRIPFFLIVCMFDCLIKRHPEVNKQFVFNLQCTGQKPNAFTFECIRCDKMFQIPIILAKISILQIFSRGVNNSIAKQNNNIFYFPPIK